MKKLVLLVALATILSAQVFKCTYMSDLDGTNNVQVNTTVTLGKTASMQVDGVGTFHYKFKGLRPTGHTEYQGTDNEGYLFYNKLTPSVILVSDNTYIGGCTN